MSVDFVRTMILREVVGSTSDEARALVAEGGQELPLLVRARRQTAGRGRGENLWWSDEGSLTFTIALDPLAHGLAPEQGPQLALAVAVALVDALEPDLPGAALGIRWPNDIEAAGRKLGGVLPELVPADLGHRLLIGIGLNVRTRFEAAPEEVRRLATSVEKLAGRPLGDGDMERLFASIVDRFASTLQALAAGEPGLPARWSQLDALAGRQVRVNQGARFVRGVVVGIDAEGRLRVWSDGQILSLSGGQVVREIPTGS
jgi:BirA family transcriptional regulator, biotin operon repressor / biotin---[acetyl-CoA-carboxylase] ligase